MATVHLKTIQASAFKSVFEVLKDILNDVNIYFTPDGIRILTLDTAHTSLIDTYMKAENFEEYMCNGTVIAGVNITNTFKILKSVTNNDTLTLDIIDADFMEIRIENPLKRQDIKFRLKLLEINEDRIEPPDVSMSVTTTMPSSDFQRICRDMNNLAVEVEIRRTGQDFIVKCEGDFAHQDTKIECIDTMKFEGNIYGMYSLKYLNLFTKATSMCANIQIMQEEANRFLVLKYDIANLGVLKFYLATKASDV
jgi:proliferating cell nuclear antigen